MKDEITSSTVNQVILLVERISKTETIPPTCRINYFRFRNPGLYSNLGLRTMYNRYIRSK